MCAKGRPSVYPMEGNLVLHLASLSLQPRQNLCRCLLSPPDRNPSPLASLAWLIWDMEPASPIIKLIDVCLCQFIPVLSSLPRRQWAWAGVSQSENKSSTSSKLPLCCEDHIGSVVTWNLYSGSSFLFFIIRAYQSFLQEYMLETLKQNRHGGSTNSIKD